MVYPWILKNPEMGEGISQVKVVRVERWGDKPSLDVLRAQSKQEPDLFSQIHAGNLVQDISHRCLKMTGNYS